MFVQHNLASMNANRQLNINEKKKASSSEKLTSGYRINRAADDAAGLTISDSIVAQASQNMLAQANAQPQQILSLLE